MYKKVLVCILVLLCFVNVLPVYALSSEPKYQIPEASDGQINEAIENIVPLRFLPDHPFYFLIVIKETFNSFFQPSSAKAARFQAVLSGKRLKETYRLIQNGNNSGAFDNLEKYRSSNYKIIRKLNKAIGQNQEVTPLIMEIAEGLKSQEVLFFAILKNSTEVSSSDEYKKRFEGAIESFIEVAMAINNIKPGIKDRFKTVTWFQGSKEKEQSEATSSASPEPGLFESTPSVKPKRIIY